MRKLNYLLAAALTGTGLLAACTDTPAQMTTTSVDTTQQTVPVPSPPPVMPGTVTTQTSHTATYPAQ